MGTRADFYVGKNEGAEWIGSIAWDGYRDGIPESILKAKTEESFREAVDAFSKERDDWTAPEQGWPWPWNDSSTTDCSYWFFGEQVWEERRGSYLSCKDPEPESEAEMDEAINIAETVSFPDMSERKSVTFGRRSGLIILG